jgi:hypothetical protein
MGYLWMERKKWKGRSIQLISVTSFLIRLWYGYTAKIFQKQSVGIQQLCETSAGYSILVTPDFKHPNWGG